jgi:DNA-binding transcriptional regulator GbsR (MarR family)
MPLKKLPELKQVSDRIGNFMHYWGFSKIDGKVWAHLYLSNAPLSSADLRAHLGVSKALLSLAINELLKYGVIRQTGTGKHGTALYESVSDLRNAVENVLRTRERIMLADITATVKRLEKKGAKALTEAAISLDKAIQLREMSESAEIILEQLILANAAFANIAHFDGDE